MTAIRMTASRASRMCGRAARAGMLKAHLGGSSKVARTRKSTVGGRGRGRGGHSHRRRAAEPSEPTDGRADSEQDTAIRSRVKLAQRLGVSVDGVVFAKGAATVGSSGML